MTKSRFSEKQIIGMIKEQEDGLPTANLEEPSDFGVMSTRRGKCWW